MPAEVAKSVEGVKDGESDTPKTPAAKPMVGIIYPPPEVRNIVDKTAGFVARNGPEFEGRIRQNEVSNAKFNFLNPGDPYHAYYRHKVKEFLEGKGTEPTIAITKIAPAKPVIIEAVVPKDPPATFEFIADPPSINSFDLDIVKLTAQFVARNGRQFLTNLMNKESRNYAFDFLRPQHSMFNYFTKLVEQYTRVLIPPKDLQKKLRGCNSMKAVLGEVHYRVEWEKLQEKKRKKEEEAKERERVAYAQIDWHNFVVVETVDYQPNEQGQFPPPLKQGEVGNRVIAEERFEQFGEALAEDEDVEMEVEDVDEDEDSSSSSDSSESEDEDREKTKTAKKREKKEKEKEKEKEKRAVDREEDEEEDDEDEAEEDTATREKLAEDATTPPLETKGDQNTEVQDMEEGDSDMEESDEEEEAEKDGESSREKATPGVKEGPPMPPPPLPPQPGEVQIRKDYDPKAPKPSASGDKDDYLVSPITGSKIPADKMQEHMRIGLLDQRWMEQRSQTIERAKEEEVFAASGSITENLKKLAERRTDIFGEGDVETQIGKKIGEEEDPSLKQKVIWDGHSASMESTTRKAQANISIEEQIEALHKAQGLLPDEEKERIGPKQTGRREREEKSKPPRPPPKPKAPPPLSKPPPIQRNMPPLPPPPTPVNVGGPPGMPVHGMRGPAPMMPPQGMMGRPMMGGPPMGMPRPPPMAPPQRMMPPPPPGPFPGGGPGGPLDGEPPAKRQKTEDMLIPENHFLSMHRSPMSFRVHIPSFSDKPEWKLNGQMMNITMPLTDQISVLKAKIFEELGMPAGKQKLQYEGMFVKDSNSIAFYNFMPGCIVQLHVKERGGRKR